MSTASTTPPVAPVPVPHCTLCPSQTPITSISTPKNEPHNEVVQYLIKSSSEMNFPHLSSHLLAQKDIQNIIHLCVDCSAYYLEISQVYSLFRTLREALAEVLSKIEGKIAGSTGPVQVGKVVQSLKKRSVVPVSLTGGVAPVKQPRYTSPLTYQEIQPVKFIPFTNQMSTPTVRPNPVVVKQPVLMKLPVTFFIPTQPASSAANAESDCFKTIPKIILVESVATKNVPAAEPLPTKTNETPSKTPTIVPKIDHPEEPDLDPMDDPPSPITDNMDVPESPGAKVDQSLQSAQKKRTGVLEPTSTTTQKQGTKEDIPKPPHPIISTNFRPIMMNVPQPVATPFKPIQSDSTAAVATSVSKTIPKVTLLEVTPATETPTDQANQPSPVQKYKLLINPPGPTPTEPTSPPATTPLPPKGPTHCPTCSARVRPPLIHTCYRNIGQSFCRYCRKCSKFPNRLQDHMTAKHPTHLTHPCTYCPKTYTSPLQLSTHTQTHLSSQPPYTCLVCQTLLTDPDVDQEKLSTLTMNFETPKSLETHLLMTHVTSSKSHSYRQCLEFDREGKITPTDLSEELGIQKPPKLDCQECGMILLTISELKAHTSTHKNNHNRHCDICARNFPNSYHLFKHVLDTHENGEKLFDCSKCDEQFCTRFMWVHHKRYHMYGGSPHVDCSECLTRYPERGWKRLDMHMVVVHGREPKKPTPQQPSKVDKPPPTHKKPKIPCPHCPKTLNLLTHLRLHLQQAHPHAFSHKCPSCPSIFFDPEHLSTHAATHTAGPYVCSLPHSSNKPILFISASHLTTHLMTHTGEEKKLKCPWANCQQHLFKSELKKHLLIHDPHPFKCPHCPKSFKTKPQLTFHTYRHTRCKKCGEEFESYTTLLEHKKTDHKGKGSYKYVPHVCEMCSKVLPSREEYSLHRKSHVIKCYFCGKVVKWYSMLRRHLASHTKEKEYACHICGVRLGHSNLHSHFNKHKKWGDFVESGTRRGAGGGG